MADTKTAMFLDVEKMLKETIPGGNLCDPQKVCDAIRNWISEHAPTPAAQSAGQEAVFWRDLLSAVTREINDREYGHPWTGTENAPGHAHDIPGIWDSDNGDKAGTKCAWCMTWNKAREALNAAPVNGGERAADAPQVGGSLTKEEIDFVLAVFGNPDAKRAYAGDYSPAERPPVWEAPELLGLIVATGSYKWRPTEKLRGIMRAALSSPAKDAEQKPMTDRQIIKLCESVGVEWEGPDMCDFMGDFGRVNMAGMRAIINAAKEQK